MIYTVTERKKSPRAFIFLSLAVSAVLVLSGCQPAPTRLPVSTPEANVSPTALPARPTYTQVAPSPTATPARPTPVPPSPTLTLPPAASLTPLLPATQPATPTATPLPSPTPAETATPEASPTPAQPALPVTVKEQAFCRYGPAQAYLYSHGLYAGDQAEANGRNASGTWLWIKPANLDRHCWSAASLMEFSGNVKSLPVVHTRLPHSTLYGPPGNVSAIRDGDTVTVTWARVWMTQDDDRGYLVEATVCQDGRRTSLAVHVDSPSYTFTDERNCSGGSGGKLYTVEKHGYTDPVEIPWPE